MAAPERWFLDRAGSRHMVEVLPSRLQRRLVWWVDGVRVAEEIAEGKVVLDGGRYGALSVRLVTLGPARRVTWWPSEGKASAPESEEGSEEAPGR